MLTYLEKQILCAVQEPLTLCQCPFAEMAVRLGCPQEQLLSILCTLKEKGFIRRYRAKVNYSTLGRAATLVAVSVPREKLDTVVAAVNVLAGVSHNYLRDHHFNLWFTLQDESPEAIENTLCRLSKQTKMVFYSLPTEKMFKLNVRFCPDGPSAKDFEAGKFSSPQEKEAIAALTEAEKKTLRILQEDFPIVEKPFEKLGQESGIANLMQIVESLIAKRIIRRIAAALDHRKLGYNVNVMACFALPNEKIEEVAYALSAIPAVSHCYQRKTFAGWPYNLFAMIHAGRVEDIERFISSLVKERGISDYVLLPTITELKKSPV
jgi:DNA-binding Lrp family transcriptional regulator